MYIALLILLISSALLFIVKGLKKQSLNKIIIGVFIASSTAIFFGLLNFWADLLWFESLGYEQRFWKIVISKAGFTCAGALLGLTVVTSLTWTIPKNKTLIRISSKILGFFIGAQWGFLNWDIITLYINRVMTDFSDPIFHKNMGFFLFVLPFYDNLYYIFLTLSVISIVTVVISLFVKFTKKTVQFMASQNLLETTAASQYRSFYISAAVLVFVLAWGKYLDKFHLMYSTYGAVTGPGWTDVNVRLSAYTIVVFITTIVGLFLVIPFFRKKLQNFFIKLSSPLLSHVFTLASAGIIILIFWIIGLGLVPKLFQWLHVEPNEITLEKLYISYNIQFTRHGFKLNDVEEKEFPASENLTQQMVKNNQNLFSNIRLWDWRALDAVYRQFQEIRLYYEFIDVDIDRYNIKDSYRQVMVSAREMDLSNLPQQSQTFVNRRFKYTHGYGITLSTVNEFTIEGLPNLLIKDIPPKTDYTELEVKLPQIYYGELTNTYALVNTKEKEFDYPLGEENAYIHYTGNGGVELSNLWRKFLFGWKFDGTRFFLSNYPTSQSRIMFHRQIQERVEKIAPFLYFDDDPYIVLIDGKLYWIIDAYTTSTYYPYSEPFSSWEIIEYRNSTRNSTMSKQISSHLDGINYIRNSVKVVVDAYNGSVDFYIFDENDPLIQVWNKVFPHLFKQKEDMPEGLRAHVRYPSDMLLVQGLVYAKYHMNDPAVFYNQEDLWIRATEKYYNQIQPVEPYYVMWKPPGSEEPEFSLILPFTPKNRQVLIGWIAGLCDGDNYGRFLAYKFPKEKRVLGPQQVETKVDQDSYLSGQLTLWNQQGSRVIRGNVLAIPIEDTVLYVEPIYLQAETAAYPELRLVALMHNDRLSYAETFEEALQNLLKEDEYTIQRDESIIADETSLKALVKEANNAFESYLTFLGQKRFNDAAQELETLQKLLNRLSEKTDESR